MKTEEGRFSATNVTKVVKVVENQNSNVNIKRTVLLELSIETIKSLKTNFLGGLVKYKAGELTKLMVGISSIYNSADNAMREIHRNIKYLGGVTGRDCVSSKLIKAGILCIAGIPEPVISNTVGATLIATGTYIRKREVGLKELPETLGKHIIELRKIREILHELKI